MEEMNNGTIRISDEVVADIAIRAAMEVEGVAGVRQRILETAKNLVASRVTMVKGISFVPTEDGLDLTIQISVLFGYKIQEVCVAVQQEIASAVVDMTGIAVRSVNVGVVGISVPKNKSVGK